MRQLIHGDCLESMRSMETGSFAGVVTSPPYNLRTGGAMKTGNSAKWTNSALQHGYADHEDAMHYDDYCKWQNEVLRECWRLIDDEGAIFYNHKWRIQKGRLQQHPKIIRSSSRPPDHHLAASRRDQLQQLLLPADLRGHLPVSEKGVPLVAQATGAGRRVDDPARNPDGASSPVPRPTRSAMRGRDRARPDTRPVHGERHDRRGMRAVKVRFRRHRQVGSLRPNGVRSDGSRRARTEDVLT